MRKCTYNKKKKKGWGSEDDLLGNNYCWGNCLTHPEFSPVVRSGHELLFIYLFLCQIST